MNAIEMIQLNGLDIIWGSIMIGLLQSRATYCASFGCSKYTNHVAGCKHHTQQRLIKKYLQLHLGKCLFLPLAANEDDIDHYYIPTSYGEYKYYKGGDNSQKPEWCSY